VLPTHIKLALEIVGQHGVDISLRAAVADRCVQTLSSGDLPLICTAMRCLLGMGEVRRLRCNAPLKLIRSGVSYVRNCGVIIATVMAMVGTEMSSEVLDSVMDGVEDGIVETFLVTACFQPHAALYLVNRIAYEKKYRAELIFKILVAATKHEEVRPAVMIALKIVDLAPLEEEWGDELRRLREFVNR
jgi:hypothetical protein